MNGVATATSVRTNHLLNDPRAEARNAKSWQGKSWSLTNHNLDRIYTRDGLAYGAEIKNTQNYISRDELLTKLQLSQQLGVIPLFIMRFAPKSYVFDVIRFRMHPPTPSPQTTYPLSPVNPTPNSHGFTARLPSGAAYRNL